MTTAFEAERSESGSQTRLDVVSVDQRDSVAWDAYVEQHPSSSGYHLYGWRGVFERAFGHPTYYLLARRGGQVVGVLPLVEVRSMIFGRSMVSLPFVNYGGVLASNDQAAEALFKTANERAASLGLDHVELRHRTAQFPNAPSKRHKVTMLLPLAETTEAMWNQLDRKVRNQVRKAEKSGLEAKILGADGLDAFYSIFATNMRDLGTPVYAKRLFAEVFAAFPDRTSCIVVHQADRPLAAGIGFRYRETMEMPWASSLKEYRALCGNVLLYWRALEHTINAGGRVFDFGRSTPDEGTFHFKRQWGANPHPLYWEYGLLRSKALPDHSPTNAKFALAVKLWQRLPLAIANLLGPAIVKGIP